MDEVGKACGPTRDRTPNLVRLLSGSRPFRLHRPADDPPLGVPR